MSDLEDRLLVQIREAGLPEPVREYVFAKPRRWRLDFAWVEQKVAVEVEGGIWIQGRHNRGKGYESDLEKHNELTMRGWRLLRFGQKMVDSGSAVEIIGLLLDHLKGPIDGHSDSRILSGNSGNPQMDEASGM